MPAPKVRNLEKTIAEITIYPNMNVEIDFTKGAFFALYFVYISLQADYRAKYGKLTEEEASRETPDEQSNRRNQEAYQRFKLKVANQCAFIPFHGVNYEVSTVFQTFAKSPLLKEMLRRAPLKPIVGVNGHIEQYTLVRFGSILIHPVKGRNGAPVTEQTIPKELLTGPSVPPLIQMEPDDQQQGQHREN